LQVQENKTSLLKFSEHEAVHQIVADKINQQVDQIAIERELELEDEDTLIERKKEELKRWFQMNYSNEV